MRLARAAASGRTPQGRGPRGRVHLAGALAALAIAGVGAYALPAGTSGWAPVTYGLSASPDQVLPAVVSPAQPVRVVSTTLDRDGSPVITVRQATDRAGAAELVRNAQQAQNAVGVEADAVAEAADAAGAEAAAGGALGVPGGNDPYRSMQWDLDTMRVSGAWPRSTGAGVTVAVVDTGVDASHEDLAGRVAAGYDAIAGTAGAGTDANGHGTHVAGTIAARTGNGFGVAAAAPDAQILPVRALGADGRGYMSDVAEGIVWAVDHGAQVINLSLGSDVRTATVVTAVGYARSRGVVVIAAAGNSRASGSPTSYPAADEGVIAVGATDSRDLVAGYSNAGSYVDVAAPGSEIVSTYPPALVAGGYALLNGTSMASPHVAATAALLLAAHPSLTPDQVEAALTVSAVDLGPVGKDMDYGSGRIDAVAALDAAASITAATAPGSTAPSVTTAPTSKPPATTAPPSPSATTAPTTAPSSPSPTAPTTTPPGTKAPTTTPPVTKAPTSTPTSSAPASSAPTVTPTPAKPVVTTTVGTRQVAYGTLTRTTFSVSAGGSAWSGKPVDLCVSQGGGAWVCTDVRTGAAGTYTDFRRATGAFRVRLLVPAGNGNTAAQADSAYSVRAVVTVARSGKGALTVRVTGAAGQNVNVERYVRGRWTVAKRYTGAGTRKVTGLVRGGTYRAVVGGTSSVQGMTSRAVKA